MNLIPDHETSEAMFLLLIVCLFSFRLDVHAEVDHSNQSATSLSSESASISLCGNCSVAAVAGTLQIDTGTNSQ